MKELMESPLESKSIMINTGLKKEPFLPDVPISKIIVAAEEHTSNSLLTTFFSLFTTFFRLFGVLG